MKNKTSVRKKRRKGHEKQDRREEEKSKVRKNIRT
jgi:hypothetical protein